MSFIITLFQVAILTINIIPFCQNCNYYLLKKVTQGRQPDDSKKKRFLFVRYLTLPKSIGLIGEAKVGLFPFGLFRLIGH